MSPVAKPELSPAIAQHVDSTASAEPAETLAEQNLRLREELALLRSALDASKSGILILDMLRPGRPVLYANSAVARRAGMTVDELIGQPSVMLTPREENVDSGPQIREA